MLQIVKNRGVVQASLQSTLSSLDDDAMMIEEIEEGEHLKLNLKEMLQKCETIKNESENSFDKVPIILYTINLFIY